MTYRTTAALTAIRSDSLKLVERTTGSNGGSRHVILCVSMNATDFCARRDARELRVFGIRWM